MYFRRFRIKQDGEFSKISFIRVGWLYVESFTAGDCKAAYIQSIAHKNVKLNITLSVSAWRTLKRMWWYHVAGDPQTLLMSRCAKGRHPQSGYMIQQSEFESVFFKWLVFWGSVCTRSHRSIYWQNIRSPYVLTTVLFNKSWCSDDRGHQRHRSTHIIENNHTYTLPGLVTRGILIRYVDRFRSCIPPDATQKCGSIFSCHLERPQET